VRESGDELIAYHDRQLIADGESYLRRYSFLQTDGTYSYDDYVVEDTTKASSSSAAGTESTWFIGP